MNIITFIPLTNDMLGRLVTLMIADELARQDAARAADEAQPAPAPPGPSACALGVRR